MKSITRSLRYTFGVGLLAVFSANAQSDLVLNTFATGNEANLWRNHWGVPGPFGWDPASDADGQVNSGSLKITNTFPNNPDWQQCATTRDLTNFVDTAGYANLSLDVRALGSSVPTGYSWLCDLRLLAANTNWTYVPLGEVIIIGTNWTHIEVPLKLAATNRFIQAVTLQVGGSGFTGPLVLWVDNLKLTAPPQPPPPLTIQPAGSGVELYASAPAYTNSGVYQRQDIRTATGNYAWAGRSVTYAVTISDFPEVGHDLFDLHMSLVGNSANPGATADWYEPNVIHLVLSGGGETGYYMQVHYKFNAPNSTPWDSPLVLGHSGTGRPIGTFGISISENFEGTRVSIQWPGGQSADAQLPSAISSYFNSSTHLYVGVTPGKANNIGQSATIRRVQITGAATSLDDTFSNLSNWLNVAEDAAGVVLHPTNTIAKMTWLPPAGTWRLQQRSDLNSGSWGDSPLSVFTVGGRKLAFATSSPSVDRQFFRLKNP